MALPRHEPLLKVLGDASRNWTRAADDAADFRDRLAAGPVSAGSVLGHLEHIRNAINDFEDKAATPGIGDYATEQYGDSYDIGPDFDAFITALKDVRAWIVNNFPQGTEGYVLEKQINADGSMTTRTFAPTDTTQLRTLLDALVATVE